MGVDVIIRNDEHEGKELTMHDIILPGMLFGSIDDTYRLNKNVISEVTTVFSDEHVCRGHEVQISNGSIILRLPLPASRKDIIYFYRHIKFICQMLKTDKFVRDESEMTIDNINMCIELDSSTSIQTLRYMKENMDSGEYKDLAVFGVFNPVYFGKEELDQIGEDIDAFGEVMNNIFMQNIYYPATTMFYDEEKKLCGIIGIPENVVTAFPTDPKPYASKNELHRAYVAFIANKEALGCISFDDFIANVDKSRKYDATHFIISLNITEINELLKKYKREK